jgi:uncharacterized protein (TIGR02145 family)
MKVKNYKLQIHTLSPWSVAIGAIALLFLAACTDYVQDIEDQRDEWREEQASLLLSSEEQDISSSSKITNKESSSSSAFDRSSSSVESDSTDVKDSSSSSSTSEKSSSSEEKGVSSSSEISSSSVTSSSSAVTSSSTSEIATTSSSNIIQTSSSTKESWVYLNPAISYAEMTDERDGQVYKTVVIGDQEWMAENLNYGTRVAAGTDQKYESFVERYCYNNDTIECKKYGALYQWTEAMQLPYDCWYKNCSNLNLIDIDGDGFHQGICPDGWHIPSQTEWETLFSNIGGVSATTAKKLKSLTEWNSIGGNEGNGLDSYGFSALPSGMALNNGNYENEGQVTFFWSTKEYGTYQAYYVNLTSSGMGLAYHGKTNGISVRCTKDNPNNIVASSSSENALSSASKESWAYLNPSYSYGEMTDERDGQTYKTIEIQGNIWMAENLNFETENSYCYNNNTTYCNRYGRLYIWPIAMDSAGTYSSNGKGCGNETCSPNYPVRGICPEGWHLPSSSEWYNLVDPNPGSGGAVMLSAISASYTGYGVPGKPMSFGNDNDNALFWSSTNGPSDGYASYIFFSNDYGRLEAENKYYAFSVRCVKDD